MDHMFAVEFFDKDILWNIINNRQLYGLEKDIVDVAGKYYRLSLDQGKLGMMPVHYSKRSGSWRLFADRSMGLQIISKQIRHTIAKDQYNDVDMVNAYPTILEYICYQHKIKCIYLSGYNKNRKEIDRLHSCLTVPSKDIMNGIICGGDAEEKQVKAFKIVRKKAIMIDGVHWIEEFSEEMKRIRKDLCALYPKKYKEVKYEKDPNHDPDEYDDFDDKENYRGSLISRLMSEEENKALKIIIDFFKSMRLINKKGLMNAVLCHDGIMIQKSRGEIDEKTLSGCEEKILSEMGLPMKLKVKPMNQGVRCDTIPSRPDSRRDIFLYKKLFRNCTTWASVLSLKRELVHFVNKNTIFVCGSKPMIIVESLKHNPKKDTPADNIVRTYKSDKGFACEMANAIFKVCLSADEMKNNGLTPTNLIIKTYNTWLTSEHRRTMNNIIFDPEHYYSGKRMDHSYNLFSGLNIERDTLNDVVALREDAPYFQHILRVWCSGRTKEYEYVLNWIASIIQNPGRKLRSCIVLKSVERAGKGIGVDPIRDIIGQSYVFHPTTPDEILGNFNSGCSGKLLGYLDELSWGGDKERAGGLKKIISEKTMSINEKFRASYTVDNHMNLIISSNEEWIVPAGTTDTRYFCLQLSPELSIMDRKEKAIRVRKVIDTDPKALAKFFYERDIVDWKSDDIPITDALRDQRISSMNPSSTWIYDSINAGYFRDEGQKYYFDELIPREILWKSCMEYYKKSKYPPSRTKVYKIMRETFGRLVEQAPRMGGSPTRCFMLLKVGDARKKWKAKYGDAAWVFDIPELPEEVQGVNQKKQI